jgi:hypothetical protein
MEAFNATLQRNEDWLFFVLAAFPLLYHFSAKIKDRLFIAFFGGALFVTSGLVLILVAVVRPPLPVGTVAGVLTLYCTVLFALLGEAMTHGLGRFLTEKRGEKWPKEMEYVYLTMAAIGVIGSLNRAEFLTGRLDTTEIVPALLLATAVVIRFLKTRAEICDWNKAATWQPKTIVKSKDTFPASPSP